MSSFENDSIYNSSNDDDGDIVTNSRFRKSNSSRPPPGLTNQPTIPSQIANSGCEIPLDRQMGDHGAPNKYGKSGGEVKSKDSQEQDHLEELGLNLGRRLARLELGNKINTEKLEKIKDRCKVKEKTRAMESARVDDIEGKLISMEARLASEEKQGFDAKEKIESLEKTLKMKEKEILELKTILSKADSKRVQEEGRLSKLEEGSEQLTKQFLVLLETCETFNDELQSLKNMNIELKRELKKKEEAKVKSSDNIPSSAPLSDSGGPASQNATKPEGLPSLANGFLNFKSDDQKVTASSATKASQNAFKLSNSATDKSAKLRKTVNRNNSSVHPSGRNAQEFVHNVQEFVPRNPGSYPSYYYSGPAGPGPYYYTTQQQPVAVVYGRPNAHGAGVEAFSSADFSVYQNHEYGQN